MKKSVIFVISMIYIVSLVIVGFLGLRMRVYDEEVYVTDIVCRFEGSGVEDTPAREEVDYVYRVRFTRGIKVQVTSEVLPENATESLVDYYGYEEYVEKEIITYDEPERNVAVVTFLSRYTIIFYAKSTDGKNLTKGIQITVW